MPLLAPDLPEVTGCYGVLAQFDSAKALYRACERVRDAGYKKWDAHSPFPVHGLDDAMGMPASKLPWIVLVLGLSGAAGAMLLQWWVAVHGYPLVISGKPLFSWPAFVPVTFELGVLFGAIGAVFGMLALNRLPMLYHPLFNSKQFEQFSDDKFFISVEARDPKFDEKSTADLLKQIGSTHVELVDH